MLWHHGVKRRDFVVYIRTYNRVRYESNPQSRSSFLSAIGLLGKPAEMYTYGTQFVAIMLAYPIVMAATAYMYWPVFFKLRVDTCYEV